MDKELEKHLKKSKKVDDFEDLSVPEDTVLAETSASLNLNKEKFSGTKKSGKTEDEKIAEKAKKDQEKALALEKKEKEKEIKKQKEEFVKTLKDLPEEEFSKKFLETYPGEKPEEVKKMFSRLKPKVTVRDTFGVKVGDKGIIIGFCKYLGRRSAVVKFHGKGFVPAFLAYLDKELPDNFKNLTPEEQAKLANYNVNDEVMLAKVAEVNTTLLVMWDLSGKRLRTFTPNMESLLSVVEQEMLKRIA